ncbi:peptidase M20 [Gloeothece citriformis PCC 7424]|uniref:Peptidase M20 n=1 Tax=Gloeothece citriformis (strain PCC 7424) TaxID=65393 RepID=B7KIG6_GLOC7|nr:M20 family metallopeptidase [Gloeothece citriformis]ACK69372.1 peptidase M20 [Gloeothece citriformis PCC 7424]
MIPLSTAHHLREYLYSRREEMIELLQQLVLIESPSVVPHTQEQVFRILQQAYQRRGYRVRRIQGHTTGGQFLAIPKEHQKHQPIQLLLGHSDTVWPLGSLEKMPLSMRQGKLYGPGSYDMKAGLVFMVFAIEALTAKDLNPKVAPIVFINSDEEIGSFESQHYIKRLAQKVDRAFVLEPSFGREGKLKTRRKGLGEYIIHIKGKASHAGLAPEKGVSAILELSYLVQKLFALNDPQKGITVNVGTIDGGIRPNVVAPESKAVVDVRVLTSEDAQYTDNLIRQLEPTLAGIEMVIEGGFDRPPMEKTPGNEKLWQLAQQAGWELGLDIDEATAGGGSDGNFTSLYTPTLDGMGAIGDEAHAPGEFIYLDSIIDRTALLSRLLLEPPLNLSHT